MNHAQGHKSGILTAHLLEPAASHTGTLTILRHGHRLDTDFYSIARRLIMNDVWVNNEYITREQFEHIQRIDNPEEAQMYLDSLWRDYAEVHDFDYWNPPLAPDQTFLRNSIRHRLQNGPLITVIVSSPMTRTLQTLQIALQIFDELHLPRPRTQVVDQRLREWHHVIQMAPDHIHWQPIPGVVDAGHRLDPAVLQAESTAESRVSHHRRLSALLAEQHTSANQHTLVIGHLDTLYSVLLSDPQHTAQRPDVPTGSYIMLQTLSRSLGKRISDFGIFNATEAGSVTH